MQPTYTAEAEAYREKVQAFLAEKLPSNWQGIGALEGEELETFVIEWRKVLYEAKPLQADKEPEQPKNNNRRGNNRRRSRGNNSNNRNKPKAKQPE